MERTPRAPVIAFIGFGEAAQAFTATLRAAGAEVRAAYDIKLHGEGAGALAAAAAAQGVRLAASAAEAAAEAEVVISAVTAAASLEAVRPLAGRLGPGQALWDINSVSAARKAATAALIRTGGAGYLDMAVMAPVHPAGHRTPVLVAGDMGGRTGELLERLGFRFEVAGPEAGDATAVKMVRSLFVKGLEAITVQALAAAEASGAGARVVASLAASFPGLGWPGFAAYEFERTVTHGRRRAAELREVALTMEELGFAEGRALAAAIADLQEAVAEARPALSDDLAATARAVAEALRARRRGAGAERDL